MKVSHRKQDRVDQQTRIRVGTQMGLKSGSKAMGSRQGSPALLFDLQSYSFPQLCLSGACHFSLNCCHDLCSDGRKTTKQSEFYTAQLLLSAQTQNHISQNKFRMQGHISMGLVSTFTLCRKGVQKVHSHVSTHCHQMAKQRSKGGGVAVVT